MNYEDNKDNPFVSICLLSFNHDHMLSKVMDAILLQTYKNYELIISDNCSSDKSWEIIKEYEGRYQQIKAVRTPENIGMAGNYNFAVKHAKGKYIALLHHDDIVSDRLVEKWVAVADKDPEIGFVFNDYSSVHWDGYHNSQGYCFKEIMDGKEFLKKHLLHSWACPVRGTALIRKEYYDLLNGTDLRFDFLADVDLWMRLSEKYKVGYVAEPLIHVIHNRKPGYPEEFTTFSWKRLLVGYEIHGTNIDRLIKRGILGKLTWYKFRVRVSLDIIKWLIYGVVKGKKEIIIRAKECENPYEYIFVKLMRNILLKIYQANLNFSRHHS